MTGDRAQGDERTGGVHPPVSRARLAVGLLTGAVLAATATVGALKGPFATAPREVPASRGGDEPPVRIAAAVGLSPERAAAELAPIADYLERQLGLRVRIEPAERVEAAVATLVRSEVSIAVLPALGCVQARERAREVRYLVLQSSGERFGQDALLVGRAEGWPADLAAARGGTLCYVDQGSTAGHLAARAWLRQRGFEPAEHFGSIRWIGDHLDAVGEVARGGCDLAAVAAGALEAAATAPIRSRVRALATAGHVPTPCWVGAPRFGARQAEAVRDALTSFDAAAELGAPFAGDFLRIARFRRADASSLRGVYLLAGLERLLRPPAAEPTAATRSDRDM